jgi:hypothetical protein
MHWTGPYKNWNARCAECHATGYKKNYDPFFWIPRQTLQIMPESRLAAIRTEYKHPPNMALPVL